MEQILVPAFNALSRMTAQIQFGRDVRGDLVLIDFGLDPDKADPLVDTSVTMSHCVRYS
jgi:acetoin utilization deacetylase AcuC-like enzyme